MIEIAGLIANGATVLVAAFAGAWIAFKLEDNRRKRETIDENVAAGNRVLYTLQNMYNILRQFQKEVIDEARENPEAWLHMKAGPPIVWGFTTFDVKDLSFLLQKGELTAFTSVMLEEERFLVVIGLINQRSSLVLDEMFPRFSDAGFRVGDRRPVAEFEAILGISIVHQLKEFTAAITSHVDDDVESIKSAFAELRNVLLKIYPDRKLANVEFQ